MCRLYSGPSWFGARQHYAGVAIAEMNEVWFRSVLGSLLPARATLAVRWELFAQ